MNLKTKGDNSRSMRHKAARCGLVDLPFSLVLGHGNVCEPLDWNMENMELSKCSADRPYGNMTSHVTIISNFFFTFNEQTFFL